MNNKIAILLLMFFLHIIADFNLQLGGRLQDFKMRKTYEEYGNMYKHDHIVGMILHCFEWAFIIFIPVYIYRGYIIDKYMIEMFIGDIIIHYITDDFKANSNLINLTQDQIVHFLQILLTWITMIYIW